MKSFRQILERLDLGWNLPPAVEDAFVALGNAQRGEPEIAMVQVQFAMGGGVLSPVVEHIGDLTNRLTPNHEFHWAIEAALNKIDKGLRALRRPYGFTREFEENCKSNAQYLKTPEAEFRAKLRSAMQRYVKAHNQLTVYNHVQWLARESAVAVGRLDTFSAVTYLESLQRILEHEPDKAREYELDQNGRPRPYQR